MSKKENKLQKNNERTLMEAYFNGWNDCCNGSNTGNGNGNGNDNGNNNGGGKKVK
ncbi:MAG: hypothetical protein J6J38_05445 [Lachnospiraceae bacterium]|nr:hypothetical protein [Lachnospiraceae bacterium]